MLLLPGIHVDMTTQMVLYTNAISIPYSRIVRGPSAEATNILDLGPLHRELQAHVKKLIDSPELLFGEKVSAETATLDGHGWKDKEAVDAVYKLLPSLPHLQRITLAFLRGSLTTWTRFSAEFAPGGLIDQSTPDQKLQAWMPTTNDINEGRLGHYRVRKRDASTLSLHQYNAEAMFSRNKTIEFMNALFQEEDHTYIMREARKIDASGLERKRKAAQARLVIMNQEKEAAKHRKAAELRLRLDAIQLIDSVDALDSPPTALGTGRWTGKLLDEQLDALKDRGMKGMPSKSKLKVAEKLAAVKEWLPKYLEALKQRGLEFGSSISDVPAVPTAAQVLEEYLEEEDMEMDEDPA